MFLLTAKFVKKVIFSLEFSLSFQTSSSNKCEILLIPNLSLIETIKKAVQLL